MSKIIGILVLLLAIALPTSAQVYPPGTWGDCLAGDGLVEVFMVPSLIEGPISVPVDSSLGYAADIIIDGSLINVSLGPLSNWNGFPVAPPLVFYHGGVNFAIDYNNCHYRVEWLENGVLKYELWKFDNDGIEWHSGDGILVNGGQNVEFGTWHVVFSSQSIPERMAPPKDKSVD